MTLQFETTAFVSETMSNKSWDLSGGSMFRKIIGLAMVE
jgi:hypothetical protein